jgi:BlaI family penicillinase repressor
MPKRTLSPLSKRERQIMDAIYQLGEGTVATVLGRIDDAPSYDSVRVTLSILERKGHLTHTTEGRHYVYRPTVPRDKALRRAVRQLTKTFFSGSQSQAVLALLDESSEQLTSDDLDEIAAWVDAKRTAGEKE